MQYTNKVLLKGDICSFMLIKIFSPGVDYNKTALLPSCGQMRYYYRYAVQSPRMEEACRLLLETLLAKFNKVNRINKVGLLS